MRHYVGVFFAVALGFMAAGALAQLGGGGFRGPGATLRGPTSSTDNAIVRFNGTTGKVVQNSGNTIDDSDNLLLKPVSGATINIRSATTEVTGMSGATVTATDLIPAGAFIIGVVVRVTTTITGATAFNIGDGSDPDRWGLNIALSGGTTTDVTDFTAAGFGQFSTANDVVLTATVANFTAGAVRLVVHFIDLTAPAS